MKRLLLLLPVGAAFMVLALTVTEPAVHDPFRVTLADPDLYEMGLYIGTANVTAGTYHLDFVPNGDSPSTLTISVSGPSVDIHREYHLLGVQHDTGISTYHTWYYEGDTVIVVPKTQRLDILIDPHGDTTGPVSIILRGATPPRP